ncbi:uncharacterized protein RB166_007631 [Leptodactylus fuscus]|uniref:uncharacterized protein LOC142205083 n=1 Tax=Leptodactylus fuscus TaxID=238119 RepID=UPI003F4E6781
MKIAICFLLVALSSGFAAGAGSGLSSCKRKMTLPEADAVATRVVQGIHNYVDKKSKGLDNSEEKKILIKTALDALKMVAEFNGVIIGAIYEMVSPCLDIPEKDKKILEPAFMKGDFSKAGLFNANPKALLKDASCVVNKLFTGHNTTAVFNKVLADKSGVLGDLKGKVTQMVGSVVIGALTAGGGGVVEGVTRTVDGAPDQLLGVL